MTKTTTVARFAPELADEAHVAAAAFLARYSGRTLDAYRHDLRYFFQWANDVGLDILRATRPHIETYRCCLDERGLAASTVDRRLSTVCGFYRFAHIDGRITSNPAQYVRRPQVHPSTARGMDRSKLGVFLFTAERYDRTHAALAVLLGLNGLRVSEACATNIEDLGLERGHRTLQILGKGNKPAVIPLVPRTARTIDLTIGDRHEGPILQRRDGQRLDRRTAHRWIHAIGKRAGLGSVHPHMLRAAFIMAALDAGVLLRALLRSRGAALLSKAPEMKRRRSRPPLRSRSGSFAGFRFPPEVILLAVRWYLRYGLSYRDLEELLAERGIEVDHVTLYRWVQRFTPLIVDAARPCRHAVGDRWFVDETYVKVAGTRALRLPGG